MKSTTQVKKRYSGPHLYLVLWRAFKRIEQLNTESITDAGFRCLSDFAVLEVLLHKGDLAVSEIGEKVLLTSGSITTAVQRLEQSGHVRKLPHPEDKRSQVVTLTSAGRRLIEASFTEHADRLENIFDTLTTTERAEFYRLLMKIGKPQSDPQSFNHPTI
ncbi:MAG: MarR family transcriptional regulator [Verrucomicrobiota bacterium]